VYIIFRISFQIFEHKIIPKRIHPKVSQAKANTVLQHFLKLLMVRLITSSIAN